MTSQSSPEAGTALLEVDYEPDRSRLTTLVQPLLAFPQYLVISLATLPLFFVIVYSWFALLITARWPSAPFRWISGWVGAAIRVWAYLNIISSRYPPWTTEADPAYEVRLLFGPPKSRYSRLKILLRFVLIIPAYFAGAVGGMLLYALAAASWLVILVSGRQPESIFRLQRTGLGWFTLYALVANLLVEDYDWEVAGASTS